MRKAPCPRCKATAVQVKTMSDRKPKGYVMLQCSDCALVIRFEGEAYETYSNDSDNPAWLTAIAAALDRPGVAVIRADDLSPVESWL